MNYHFRAPSQTENETFPGFCNRVLKEAKHCVFKCSGAECTAEDIAIRYQIIIGTRENAIREEALKKSWDLNTVRREGMKMESAASSDAEIAVNKLDKYLYQNIKKKRDKDGARDNYTRTYISCFI